VNGDADNPEGLTGPDMDTDGVADADDNCPSKSNTDQANEDGDGMGDVCDPCPPLPNASDNADMDGDGVGNGCDPSSTVNHDIVVFEGFSAPISAPITEGSWGISGGAAHVVAMSTSARFTLAWPASGAVHVRTAMTIDQIPFNQTTIGAGVIVQQDGSRGISCELTRNSSNNPFLRLLDFGTKTVIANTPSTWAAGTSGIIRESRTLPAGGAPAFACNMGTSGVTADRTDMAITPHAGLRVRALNASFDWLLIVRQR
jgi:hypothetical protein